MQLLLSYNKILISLFLVIFYLNCPKNLYSDEILLGTSLAISGIDNQSSHKWQKGMLAAIHEINKSGGVHQKKIKLISLDDTNNTEQIKKNISYLVKQEKIFAFFGALGPERTKLSLESARQDGTLCFASNSSANTNLLVNSENIPAFSLKPDITAKTDKLIGRFIEETSKNRISVFYDESIYGNEYLNAVRNILEKKELTLHSFSSTRMEKNSGQAALKLYDSKPDVILIAADEKDSEDFIRHIRKKDGQTTLIIISDLDPIFLATSLMNQGIGVVIAESVPFPFYRKIPLVNTYTAAVESYKKQDSSIEMDYLGFEAYLNMHAFAHILNQSPKLSKEDFIETAYKQFEEDLGGFRFTFSKNQHIGSSQIYPIQIAPGGFVSPIRSFKELYEFHP